MADLFRPVYKDRRTGKMKQSRLWYARIRGKRVPLKVSDRRIAERKAVEVERQLELGHDPDQLDRSRRRPMLEHLLAFEDSLKAKGNGARHLETLLPRLRKVIEGCGIATLADVDEGKLESWLARQQHDGVMAAQTRKHYSTHLKQLGRWLVASGRAIKNPFAGLRTNLNVEADRRHRRRAITTAELELLLASTAASPKRHYTMAGAHRCLLYAVALGTGLRRNELGRLTPSTFDLTSEPPSVTVGSAFTKNRKKALLPLRRDLAVQVAQWLQGRAASEILFPITGRYTSRMIRADLEAAGVPYNKDGRILDFHALRVSYVTNLALGGVPLAVAQKLARHSDPRLTANVYTQLGIVELGKALESLPPLPIVPPVKSSSGSADASASADDSLKKAQNESAEGDNRGPVEVAEG